MKLRHSFPLPRIRAAGRDPRVAKLWQADPRIVWATGHYRNGVLLTPATADIVVAELAREPVEHAFGPGRFVRAGAAA